LATNPCGAPWSASSTGAGPTHRTRARTRPSTGWRAGWTRTRRSGTCAGTRTGSRAWCCFERCLAELPADGRALILEYYAAEGRLKIDGRKRLAAALGLSDTALRNRAQRLRDRLERCVRRRLDSGADTKP
jgi:DNA-directed RNA polymerase specialized sigma24 family protein